MDNYYSFSEEIDKVVEEYEKFKAEPEAYPDWIGWNPDTMLLEDDGGEDLDWKILPVYGSKEIVEGRYGIEWRVMTGMLWSCWSSLWDVLFKYFDFDSVDVIAFSKLNPGQRLESHTHEEYGDNLIFHMGVEIPFGDVGIESSCGWHQWKQPGEWIVFDPSEAHSAWNMTDKERVVLYVNFKP